MNWRGDPCILTAVILSAIFSSTLVRGQEPDIESVMTRALTADRENRFQEAAQAYREAARLRPSNPYIRYNLALLLFKQGFLTEALPFVEQAIALDSGQPSFYILLGTIFRDLDNPALAEKAFESAVRLSPETGEGYIALADLYQSGSQLEKSAQALRSYLELHPEDAEVLYFLGSVLSYQNKWEEAGEVLERVLRFDPKHARAWFRKAHIESQERETMEKAVESYQTSLALDDSYAYGWYEYGALLGKRGESEKAVEALERAAELDPELTEAYYSLGTLLSRAGRTEEAQKYLDRFKTRRGMESSQRAQGRRALAAFSRGRKLLEENRLEEAVEAFLEMTELNPKSHQGYAFLAKAYRSLGQSGVAVGYVKRAMELSPGTSEYPYLLSLFLRDKGDLAGSLEATRLAVSLDPQNGFLHNALGVLLHELRDYSGAAGAIERASELDPSNPAYALNLAAAFEKLGEKEKSEAAMERYRNLIEGSSSP